MAILLTATPFNGPSLLPYRLIPRKSRVIPLPGLTSGEYKGQSLEMNLTPALPWATTRLKITELANLSLFWIKKAALKRTAQVYQDKAASFFHKSTKQSQLSRILPVGLVRINIGFGERGSWTTTAYSGAFIK